MSHCSSIARARLPASSHPPIIDAPTQSNTDVATPSCPPPLIHLAARQLEKTAGLVVHESPTSVTERFQLNVHDNKKNTSSLDIPMLSRSNSGRSIHHQVKHHSHSFDRGFLDNDCFDSELEAVMMNVRSTKQGVDTRRLGACNPVAKFLLARPDAFYNFEDDESSFTPRSFSTPGKVLVGEAKLLNVRAIR